MLAAGIKPISLIHDLAREDFNFVSFEEEFLGLVDENFSQTFKAMIKQYFLLKTTRIFFSQRYIFAKVYSQSARLPSQ